MEAEPDVEREASAQRTRSFLFGCALTSENRKFRFPKGGQDLEELLCLRMVCLGPGAPDQVHVLEAEGASQSGRPLKVPLAALKLCLQPTVNLGGIELTPPVTFRLRAGAGPLYVSGQHLVTEVVEEEENDDEDHGGAAAKVAPKRATPGPQKRAHSGDPSDPSVAKANLHLKAQQLNHGPKVSRLSAKERDTRPVENATHSSKANKSSQGFNVSMPVKPTLNNEKMTQQSKKSQKAKESKAPLSVDEIKARLLASVKKGVNLPKVFPKFEKFLKHCHRAEDPTCVQELWKWRQSLK